jgi:hypothetical protein
MMGYIGKVAQRHRLKKNGLDDVIDYCHEIDKTTLIPVFREVYITLINGSARTVETGTVYKA